MQLRSIPALHWACEFKAFESLDTFYKKNRAYSVMMATRPQMIGYALTDSPAGLAAWMYDYNGGEPERLLTKELHGDHQCPDR